MTSALKRVDVAVYTAIPAAKPGTLTGGTDKQFSAKLSGVGYGKWSSKVSRVDQERGRRAVRLLKAGKIKGIPATVK